MRTAVATASTSIDAYRATGPRLGAQQQAIIKFLARHSYSRSWNWTRKEIAQKSGIRLSAVCGRIAELIKAGIVDELERRPDLHTGVASYPVRLMSMQRGLFE